MRVNKDISTFHLCGLNIIIFILLATFSAQANSFSKDFSNELYLIEFTIESNNEILDEVEEEQTESITTDELFSSINILSNDALSIYLDDSKLSNVYPPPEQ